ncbi:MAG: efflux RND transporter periplasmic adaptor subunit [Deltaproteobacteria bacterium]|nr:efflux RND transporter periplasmic adaptor subunit [Deltaproteobacteria bacterium]
MKKIFFVVIFIFILAGTFFGGIRYSQRGSGNNPVLREGGPAGPASQEEMDCAVASATPGAVKITPQRQQQIGVRVEKVERVSGKHVLRTLGRVAANENLTYRLLSSTDGWVSSLKESTTGSLVKKDQLMATIYNYQFLTREQQYLYALDFDERRQKAAKSQSAEPQSSVAQQSKGQLKDPQSGAVQTAIPTVPAFSTDVVKGTPGGETNPAGRAVYSIRDQLEVAKLELYALGVGDYQIQEIARTRKLVSDIELRSPVTGFIISRNISPSQRLGPGVELFRVADLSRVWISADVFGREAQYIRPGMTARVFLPEYNKVYRARVSDILPQVDPTTRTLKVRLETDNPGFALRPDMFVDVEFQIDLPPAVSVPVDALIDSGLKKTVFVDLGGGVFEPREVETGWRFGNRTEIVRGLKPGERIAMSGTFLIDSESRLELAAAGMVGVLSTDPVSGQEISMSKAEKAGMKSVYQGQSYYFKSAESKAKFDKNPAHYVQKTAGEAGVKGRTVSPPAAKDRG